MTAWRVFTRYQPLISLGLCLLLSGVASTSAQQNPGEVLPQAGEAETLVRSGQWDRALGLLAPLEAAHRDDLRVLNLKGLALTGAGRRVEADITFARCLAIHPGYFPALKNMGINEFLLRDFSQAEAHLTQAIALSPNDRSVSLYLGQLAFLRSSYARAALLLAQAGDLVLQSPEIIGEFVCAQLEANPSEKQVLFLDKVSVQKITAPLQFEIGLALIHAGRPLDAIDFLRAAKSRVTGNHDVEFDLIIAEVGAGRFNDAITDVKELIAEGAETSELDNLASEAYEGAHMTQNAVDALRRAIALNPKAEQNYLDFAALCLDHKAYAQGLTVLTVGMQLNPQSDRLHFERGILYAAQDQFDAAEKDFALATQLAPDKGMGTLGLGVTYLQSGDAKSAVQVVRERLRSTPSDPQLLCLLGQALIKAGASPGEEDFAEAQRSLAAAVAADPRLELAHMLLGTIYLQQGRDGQAIIELEQAKALKPSDRAIYSHLAVAYRHLHQPEQMQAALATLRALNAQDRGESVTP